MKKVFIALICIVFTTIASATTVNPILGLFTAKHKASSVFEMSFMIEEQSVEKSEELFKTRLQELYDLEINDIVIKNYRKDAPNATETDEELWKILRHSVELVRIPHSRLVSVTLITRCPERSARLANAYALASESYMREKSKAMSEGATHWLKEMIARQERILEEKEAKYLAERKRLNVDAKRKMREAKAIRLKAINATLKTLMSNELVANELTEQKEVMVAEASQLIKEIAALDLEAGEDELTLDPFANACGREREIIAALNARLNRAVMRAEEVWPHIIQVRSAIVPTK